MMNAMNQRPENVITLSASGSIGIPTGTAEILVKNPPPPPPPSRFDKISKIIQSIRNGDYLEGKLPENGWQDLSDWINSFFPFSRKSLGSPAPQKKNP